MKFTYCPDCGKLLSSRVLGDEGAIPWCDSCNRPWFPMFSTCIIVAVVNEFDEVALLRQGYISNQHGSLVSGYMKPGETAEECALREVEEEIGITLDSLSFASTYWFDRKDMLMVGFVGRCKKKDFTLSVEVDRADWVKAEIALTQVHQGKAISHQLVEYYIEHREALV